MKATKKDEPKTKFNNFINYYDILNAKMVMMIDDVRIAYTHGDDIP